MAKQATTTPSKGTNPNVRRRPRIARWFILIAIVISIGYAVWNQASLRLSWELSGARDALANRDPERALSYLHAAHQIAPQNGEVDYLSAKAWRRLGQLNKAGEALKSAFKMGFDPNLLRREQWLAAAQAGQMSVAEPHLSELLMDSRDEGADICEAFVNGYFRINNPQRALPILDAWKKEFPKDERPWICLASFQETSDNWQQAEVFYREALQRAPDDLKTKLSLATVLIKQHKFRDAKSILTQCLEEAGDSPDVLEVWGNCQWEMGQTDAAAKTFGRLSKIDPNREFARWGLARQALFNRDYKKALSYLQPLVEEFPYKTEYRHALSQALQATGETELAREQFQWIASADEALARATTIEGQLQTDPNNVELRYELGLIRLRFSRPQIGVQLLLSVLDIAPNHAGVRAALYDYYRQRGNDELAERFAPRRQNASAK